MKRVKAHDEYLIRFCLVFRLIVKDPRLGREGSYRGKIRLWAGTGRYQ